MVYYDKNGIKVRVSMPEDVSWMQSRLRKADVMEVWASHHHQPDVALGLSFALSTFCLTVDVKGTPVAMFGVCPVNLLADRGIVWMLATDGICEIKKPFLKECRKFIKMMLEQYPIIENHVDARNIVSIEWLKWCGATIEEAQPWGADNLPFNHFYFRRMG